MNTEPDRELVYLISSQQIREYDQPIKGIMIPRAVLSVLEMTSNMFYIWYRESGIEKACENLIEYDAAWPRDKTREYIIHYDGSSPLSLSDKVYFATIEL